MSDTYLKAREAFLNADIDILVDDIRVILVDTADYTVDLTNHEFLDDVPAAARVAVSGALSGKSTTNGVFTANNPTFIAVVGDQFEAVIIYKHTGVEGTSRLIAYIDSATNMPFTPTGLDIILTWTGSVFELGSCP